MSDTHLATGITCAPVPIGRVSVLSNRMGLFGGVSYPYEPLLGDTWSLDLKRSTWTPLTPHTTAGSSGVPDHFGARFSQPSFVTATVSSWRMPISPGM